MSAPSIHFFHSTFPSRPELEWGTHTQASPPATPGHPHLSGRSGLQGHSSSAWERMCITVTALILYQDADILNFPKIATVMFLIILVPSALFPELCHSLLRSGVYTPLHEPGWALAITSMHRMRQKRQYRRLGHLKSYSFCLTFSFSRCQPM